MSTDVTTLPYGFAKRHGVMLLAPGNPTLVGLLESAPPTPLLEVRRAVGVPIVVQRLSRADFDRKLSEVYAGEALAGSAAATGAELGGSLDALADDLPGAADLLDSQDDAPVIRLINGLIAEAARQGASDIHIEPFDASLQVRLRVDGVMREVLSLPSRLAPLLVSRVKVMARLDIAEKRIPQDGRISLTLGSKALDVRVSTLPARGGERVVMRLLDKDQTLLGLDDLGMQPDVLAAMRDAMAQPNGIVLVTGPTGSGKTTTLYAGLCLLNDGSRNILTVEDPVEYAIQGVGQTQVNAKVGMTFAAGLRAILRQDPDVVMVGEIRDGETAQIAVQASLTGHLVLSTVHTNDAVGAITRLRDMGVEPFLLASTLRLIVAQRLVRRLCDDCKTPRAPDAASDRLFGPSPVPPLFQSVGCAGCSHTGFVGRVAIYEAVRVDETLRGMISQQADDATLARAAFARAPDLRAAARRCVASGITTVEEALRVIRQEEKAHGVV
ncbi:MAG: type II secretion system ATPase GspE [Arenimonas sp.]|uniref:type II secretion system ATPase GspE n=1 Tax=Arenimonas sp. TaxID=1872635 RepID=UPI0025BB910D|nr:type II secretion system ATPase GspE [Arenimonas sp.]MBW8366591.1 type II secretion system ATPase GspE [Arenimonas sp.]